MLHGSQPGSKQPSIWERTRPHLKFAAMRFLLAQRLRSHHTAIPTAEHVPGGVVLTLTSYPPRFRTLHLTLQSLLTQSASPSRILLWIASEDMSLLPASVRRLEQDGLEIRECVNRRSYDKLVHALAEDPGHYFVIADDDVFYDKNWLEGLVSSYAGNDKEVICHRARYVEMKNDSFSTYSSWRICGSEPISSARLVPTGIGGVLYPPNIFSKMVLDHNKYEALCPRADDIWFYFMARAAGATVRTSGCRQRFAIWPGTESVGLKKVNLDSGGNDEQFSAMIKEFGLPFRSDEK